MVMVMVMVMVNLTASCQSSLDSSFASISKTPDCIFYEPLKSSRSMSVVLYHLNTWGRHSRDQLGQLGRRSASGKAETPRQHNPSKHTVIMENIRDNAICSCEAIVACSSVPNSSYGFIFVKRRAKDGRYFSKNTGVRRAKLKLLWFCRLFVI